MAYLLPKDDKKIFKNKNKKIKLNWRKLWKKKKLKKF